MTITLGQTLDAIHRELHLSDTWSYARATTDGATTYYKLPDYPVIDEATLQCTLVNPEDGGATILSTPSNYTLDALSGGFTLVTAYDEGLELHWKWKWSRFTDEDLISLVNAGVRYISLEIRLEGLFDDTQTSELFVYEYEVPAGAYQITKVEVRSSEYDSWHKWNAWETLNLLGTLYVKFRHHPGIQEMRIFYNGRPLLFSPVDVPEDTGVEPHIPAIVVLDQELAATTGLPEFAFDPLVAYVVWAVQNRILNYRSRDDAFQHAKEESSVTMRDLETRVSGAAVLRDLTISRFASELQDGRIVL